MTAISYSKKFIFIHNPKTAGRSIRNAIFKYTKIIRLGKFSNSVFKMFGKDISHYSHQLPEKLLFIPRHSTSWELKKILVPQTFLFYKFAFVRNPWDWHVSMYHFMKKEITHPRHKEVLALENFEEFLEWWFDNGAKLQKDFFVDPSGNNLVDFVGKFENLNEDFENLCKTLNLNTTLLHRNKSVHSSYISYYNPRLIKMVQYHVGEDIEYFKYKFS